MEAIGKIDLSVLAHPPSSPDLAPHDFHLSPENEGRPSWTPVGLEEVERYVRTWMKNPIVKFLQGGC
jgi:hypothetical protein